MSRVHLVWSVGWDAGMWWLAGVGVLAGAQVAAAVLATAGSQHGDAAASRGVSGP